MSATDVLIIGAGPFGLSISAYLHELGIDHVIVGRPMDTWRSHMPAGMWLKSEPYASIIAAPKKGFDVASYCALHGLDYNHRVKPLSLEKFVGYADWFTGQLVPGVLDHTVRKVTALDDGFRVEFDDAEPMVARQVVVATGVLPYRYLPAELSGLSPDLISHAADHDSLDKFKGRKVAVVGAGQSALETAALLHEQGTEVRLIVRKPALLWNDPNPDHVSTLGHIKRPVVPLGEGWRSAFWNSPAAFRLLPLDMRLTKARTVLGPSGAWWLRERVEGILDVLASHRVREAAPHGSGVRLLLDGPGETTMDADHVIAGTGFRIDLTRLSFLSEGLLARIPAIKGYPVVSRAAESGVPGLYFVGAPTAASLGPSERFVAGTHNISAVLAKSVAHRARAGRGRLESAAASHGEEAVSSSR
jgi:FAD-dependent urate hydroxylase